jgi:hypothetical protein
MQGQPSTAGAAGSAATSKMGIGTALAAVALVIALVAVALNFAVAGPTGAKGPTGATGGQGIQGPTGPASTAYWATVNPNGTLSHGNGATGAEPIATGEYQVNFTTDVSGCGAVASIVIQNSYYIPPSGWVMTAPQAGVPDAMLVETTNLAGALADLPFDLVVTCAASNTWAVVNATGVLEHGTDAVRSQQVAGGAYRVFFNQNVSNCSFIATLGAAASGLPAAGSAAVVGAAVSLNAVWVETYNVTGVITPSSFSVVAVCTSPLWAVVSATPSLVRGSASSVTGGTGVTDVVFGQDITNCASVATAGLTGSSGVPPAGSVTMAGLLGNQFGLYITQHNPAGAATSMAFHVAVFC